MAYIEAAGGLQPKDVDFLRPPVDRWRTRTRASARRAPLQPRGNRPNCRDRRRARRRDDSARAAAPRPRRPRATPEETGDGRDSVLPGRGARWCTTRALFRRLQGRSRYAWHSPTARTGRALWSCATPTRHLTDQLVEIVRPRRRPRADGGPEVVWASIATTTRNCRGQLLAAVANGVRHVRDDQRYGERCATPICQHPGGPGAQVEVRAVRRRLGELTEMAATWRDRQHRPDDHQPYVGRSAFATKRSPRLARPCQQCVPARDPGCRQRHAPRVSELGGKANTQLRRSSSASSSTRRSEALSLSSSSSSEGSPSRREASFELL